MQSVVEGDIDALRVFMEQGGDLTFGGPDNRTPLHLACAAGQEKVLKSHDNT